MTVDQKKTERDQEVQRLGTGLSFETLMKIQLRIQRIRMYYGHFQKIKKYLPENERDLVYQVYFIAIAVLYRSVFKGLDRDLRIDVKKLGIADDEMVNDNHLSLINIADKDLVHLDKNSKSHKILDVKTLREVKSTVMVTSSISEGELEKTIVFLNLVLDPVIQEATAIAQSKK